MTENTKETTAALNDFRHAFVAGVVGTLFIAIIRTSVIRWEDSFLLAPKVYDGGTTFQRLMAYGYMGVVPGVLLVLCPSR
jgi:hypothetical protein